MVTRAWVWCDEVVLWKLVALLGLVQALSGCRRYGEPMESGTGDTDSA